MVDAKVETWVVGKDRKWAALTAERWVVLMAAQKVARKVA